MRDGFFIGWSGRTGAPLGRFLAQVAGAMLAGLLGLALLLGGAADAPADTGWGFDPLAGDAPLEGVLTTAPYPLLHLPGGRSILLAGDGKRGAPGVAGLDGRAVRVQGGLLQRGGIELLQLGTPPEALGEGTPPVAQPLGRWRISGEICDSKCAGGAMRPGTGMAHRPCANLCLFGEIPPVFVTAAAVAGSRILLLADAAGGPLPQSMLDRVALRVELEGALERRGGMLVFRVVPGGAPGTELERRR